jgi:prepilin-type N-terminal cleavage/methylation domain-containing protein
VLRVVRPSRRERGFSLIELMVVVVIIALISAIALPNFKRAMRDTRRKSAHRAAIQISNAIEYHAAATENPPPYASMNLRTLQPLVDSGAMTEGEVRSALNNFEDDQLMSYYTWNGAGWHMGSEQAFIIYFRPEGEPDAWCYSWNKWGNCWYGDGTYELFSGDWY